MLIQALLTAAVINIRQLVRRLPLPQSGMATKQLTELADRFHALLRGLCRPAVLFSRQLCPILIAWPGYGAWMGSATSG